VSMPTDGRSIGEVLLDADFQTRQLLLQVQGQDGPPMLATFDEVVQAARTLWEVLPHRPDTATAGASMRRLAALSASMRQTRKNTGWPAASVGRDTRLGEIADAFTHAAQLAGSRAGRSVAETPQGQDDLAAARARIMHTLYLGAHVVGLAVQEHVHDVQLLTDRKSSARTTRDLPRGKVAAARLDTFEQLAGEAIGTRFGDVLGRQHVEAPRGADRLQFALVEWDIQAHYAVQASASVSTLHLIAQTSTGVTTGAGVLLAAANEAGALDTDTYHHRVGPSLEASRAAWADLSATLGSLLRRSDPAPAELVAAAMEVRAALFQVAYDTTTWASPDVIASRVDLNQSVGIISNAVTATADVARVLQHTAEEGPDLSVTARGVASYSATVHTHDLDAIRAARTLGLTATDLQDNAPVSLPQQLRQDLQGQAERAAHTASAAAGATAHVGHGGVVRELLVAHAALDHAESKVLDARQNVNDLRRRLELPELAAGTSPSAAKKAPAKVGSRKVREHLARTRANHAEPTSANEARRNEPPAATRDRDNGSPHI